MRLFGKATSDLDKNDIDRLIDNQVSESIELDYKAELPILNDAGKKELLADIVAMANTAGGLLLFGLKEAKEDGKNAGYPAEVTAMKDPEGKPVNVEQLKQSLDQIIRDGIDPRLPGITFKEISYDADRFVFIIDVPRSLQAPHMVTARNDAKFYARANTGKFQMDVRQIRDAMLQMNDWLSAAEEFRHNRNREFLFLNNTPSVTLHLVPLGRRDFIDLNKQLHNFKGLLPEDRYNLTRTTYNLEGIIQTINESAWHYQLFRDGKMEARDPLIFEKDSDNDWALKVGDISLCAMRMLYHFMKIVQHYQISPPFAVFMSVLHMHGSYAVSPVRGRVRFAGGRNHTFFHGILIEDADTNIEEKMHPLFDILYQACGYSECTDYDEHGYKWAYKE
ncbi:helix-turn-helix domain-containing protein [Cohnella sp. AR92]|uniref:AlbA family DNA-binding domain-containing protein n=1 Tax=Cohnella sp. AR92 TaxID=648716 RepID=UPI000F8CE201|nr:ATP-binding protein [Cohnella sp. AR92]RUS44937.1 ATP-binding protein [Cohnella sp. AR92]